MAIAIASPTDELRICAYSTIMYILGLWMKFSLMPSNLNHGMLTEFIFEIYELLIP